MSDASLSAVAGSLAARSISGAPDTTQASLREPLLEAGAAAALAAPDVGLTLGHLSSRATRCSNERLLHEDHLEGGTLLASDFVVTEGGIESVGGF